MGLIDEVNVEVNGSSDLPSTLSTYTTKILKPNIVGEKNILTQALISSRNTKYVIKWNFDLDGNTITVPEKCALEFDGGSLKNGTIIGQDTFVNNVGGVADIFGLGIDKQGTWREHSGGGSIDIDDALSSTSENPVQNRVVKGKFDVVESEVTEQTSYLRSSVNSLNNSKANKSTSLAGYGITDAYTKSETNSKISEDVGVEHERAMEAENNLATSKANKATTLDGYNITDAYTKTEVNNLLSNAPETPAVVLDIPEGSTVADVLAAIPAADRANKIFRLRNDSNTGFSEYGWNGTDFVVLGDYETGIDDTPTVNSDNFVKSDGVKKAINKVTFNTFLCLNTKDGISYTDNDYCVNEEDLVSLHDEHIHTICDKYVSLNSNNNKPVCIDNNYNVKEAPVSYKTDLQINSLFPTAKVTDIKTIDENSEEFIGFPIIVNHKGTLYVFYRKSPAHDLTEGYSEYNIYYRFSEDKGNTWSALYYITLPDIPWANTYIDWRHYYYDSYGDYIFGCSWACVFQDSAHRLNYPSIFVKIEQNEDKTLTLLKTQCFPEIDLVTKTVSFGRDFFTAPTPNYSDYLGRVVGGPIYIKDGIMYITVYSAGRVGVVSWAINSNLIVNENNFDLLGVLDVSDYEDGYQANESTVWIDDAGVIKTLVRYDSSYHIEVSRIYSIDVVNKQYIELAECMKCEGPASIRIEGNRTVIAGRGHYNYSNLMLWDDTQNKMISEGNQYDSRGAWTGISDSFYGNFAKLDNMYYFAFYKRISASTITINYCTINRLDIETLDNSKNNFNMGTLIKKSDATANSHYGYCVPCSAAIYKDELGFFYTPKFRNPNIVNLNGKIVFGIGFISTALNTKVREDFIISVKDDINDICILFKQTREHGSENDVLNVSITYKHGEYYKMYYRVFDGNFTRIKLWPTLIADTNSDNTDFILANLVRDNAQSRVDSYEFHSKESNDVNENPEIRFDASEYPAGIDMSSTYDARLSFAGITVDGVPVLSISYIPNEYAHDRVSGKFLYRTNGAMSKFEVLQFVLDFLADYNEWILNSLTKL